jgi:hypothetical protein
MSGEAIGTPDSLGAGLVTKLITAFGGDVDFSTISGAFTGLASQARFQLPREVIISGAGILQLRGIDDADALLPLNIDNFQGLLRLTCRFRGIESTGTTFVGSVLVIW